MVKEIITDFVVLFGAAIALYIALFWAMKIGEKKAIRKMELKKQQEKINE